MQYAIFSSLWILKYSIVLTIFFITMVTLMIDCNSKIRIKKIKIENLLVEITVK